MSNMVDQNQVLQSIMARMAAARGQGSLSGIPGAAPSPSPQAAPQAQQGGMPGAVNAPQAAPQGQPQAPANPVQPGAARQLSDAKPRPFEGTFGDRKGVISQLVNAAEKRGHDKKVNEASMYYSQINSFLASNDPKDQAHAQQLLDDPKVRKILKAGLDYVPLEEEVPPEAIGVHQAQQKIDQRQSKLQQIKQLLTPGGRQQGNAQPRPQGRALIPQASQAKQQEFQLGEAKTGEQQALAAQHESEAKYNASKAESDRMIAKADQVKAQADMTRSRSEAKWYDQQAARSKALTTPESEGMRFGAILKGAQAKEYEARAKYWDRMPQGKLPGQILAKNLAAAQSELNLSFKEVIAQNNKIQEEISKQTPMSKKTGGWFGFAADPSVGAFEAQERVRKYKEAMAWFVGDGTLAVKNGTMTVADAVGEVAKRVGIAIPPPSMPADDGSGADNAVVPDRPGGVPEEANWDPATRTWVLDEAQ